jgi:PAS domain S-box-containing protein
MAGFHRMTLAHGLQPARLLLLCSDTVLEQLLRGLLSALPEPAPDIVRSPKTGTSLQEAARDCRYCIIDCDDDYAPLDQLIGTLRRAAPAIRVFGILRASRSHGDRLSLLRALRAGLAGLLEMEELSVATLGAALKEPSSTDSDSPENHLPGPTALLAATSNLIGSASPASASFAGGSWHIRLDTQYAAFDAASLRTLGYGGDEIGNSISDWKSLIHPDDTDRVLRELQRVLEGSSSPCTVNYRLRTRAGGWLSVVSNKIALHLGANDEPVAISGQFYRDHERPETDAGESMRADAPIANADEILAQCDTAMLVYRRDNNGVFRIGECNAAAARLEQCDAAQLRGARARDAAPAFDQFDIEAALARVLDTGISEARDAMSLGRDDPPHWRRLRFSRLSDDSVLAEMEDISDQIAERIHTRAEEELAEHILRSYPLTSLLIDERGQVIRCMTLDANVFALDRTTVEDGSLLTLLGSEAGVECLQQVLRTLNTGRIASSLYEVEGAAGMCWLQCSSSLLRGRPGMPERVVLTLQDVSQRVREIEKARDAREDLGEAFRNMPFPLYLKDLEGRYRIVSTAYETLFGVERAALLGKSDLEVFPDELASEMYEADRHSIELGDAHVHCRIVGLGRTRSTRYCVQFPWRDGSGRVVGSGGLWLAHTDMPPAAMDRAVPARESQIVSPVDIDHPGENQDSSAARLAAAATAADDWHRPSRSLPKAAPASHAAESAHPWALAPIQDPLAPSQLAVAPLARGILELDRKLLPASAHLIDDIQPSLPAAQCDAMAFDQIMLCTVRHARRTLGPHGSLKFTLKRSTPGERVCRSCGLTFGGEHVELVVEDPDSRLTAAELEQLGSAFMPSVPAAEGSTTDLATVHLLCHANGGHLQINQAFPSGTSVHVFLKAASADAEGDQVDDPQSTASLFPLECAGNF